MISHPYWVDLKVDGKTLMMDYEGDLVSLVIPILYFNCGYLRLSDDIALNHILYYDLYGWYDVELKCLDYGLWGVG